MTTKKRKCQIFLKPLGEKEQFRRYQRNGETLRVATGKFQIVPEWVAIRAKEIGDITEFIYLD